MTQAPVRPLYAPDAPSIDQYPTNVTTPMRRLGTPDEVASTIRYLASNAAGFITGAVMDVNGGGFMG